MIEYYFSSWKELNQEIQSLKSMLSNEELYNLVQDELNLNYTKIKKIEEKIILLLIPEDSSNKYSCFLEIRAGTGGGEAALFVKDLFRMYVRFSEIQSWKTKIIHSSHSEYGGYKEIIIKICNKKAYLKLQFESGGHRVQRIPETESQGRVHTSTCTVAVMPEMSEFQLPKIKSSDLRIDTFRSSGAGGQHINTTDSAIRITHIPTNTVVECQDERSQHKNKSRAMSVLAARLQTNLLKNRKQNESQVRRNLLGTGDRSDRIRTYNFIQGRITDHRLNLTIYKLNEILEVLGISGGQDSTLTGKICQEAINDLKNNALNYQFIAVRLPYGVQYDEEDCKLAVKFINPDKLVTINIKSAVESSIMYLKKSGFDITDHLKGNEKSRERMKIQYSIAGATSGLVVGTCHASEAITGFFTKYGDSSSDIAPILHLNKRQGRKILQYLNCPQRLYLKPPSADLNEKYPGYPDESVLGISYDMIDDYLEETMPFEFIYALAQVKYAATKVNKELNLLDVNKADVILKAIKKILSGKYLSNFPLKIWQTGSGTQTNMNINEVIANIAIKKLGGNYGDYSIIHPNDHVNKSQSSNDVFPTAMHISAVVALKNSLLPNIRCLIDIFSEKSRKFDKIIKIGRTHLQDAVPLTLGQEISAWQYMLEKSVYHIKNAISHLSEIALGGTAVGTGLNAHKLYPKKTAEILSKLTQHKFITAPNKFESLSTCDALVYAHGTLKGLSASMMKIANDIRWLSSGPRCGIGELLIPENEPGSSIMPGKVNPTQCESMTMICCQVFGNDTAISIGGASGNFQLNVFRPMIIYNFLQSVRLLSDGILSFNKNCILGIKPNKEKINKFLKRSLMLVTALAPHIGYDKSAKIANLAHKKNITLKEACMQLGYLSKDQFNKLISLENMIEIKN
uniref:fumarate hydratase n=1 Tax=Glossina austeni TaxID=7395 RepID=A0A1A9UKA4_GLOAU